MKKMPTHKYKRYEPVHLADRAWPSRIIEAAPAIGAASISGTAIKP